MHVVLHSVHVLNLNRGLELHPPWYLLMLIHREGNRIMDRLERVLHGKIYSHEIHLILQVVGR